MSVKKYDKLVRDKIPALIRNDGEVPITHIAGKVEYWQKLKEKLIEEAIEFRDSDDIFEIGDIVEVVEEIMEYKKWSWKNIEIVQNNKRKEKGAFWKRVVLDKVIRQ